MLKRCSMQLTATLGCNFILLGFKPGYRQLSRFGNRLVIIGVFQPLPSGKHSDNYFVTEVTCSCSQRRAMGQNVDFPAQSCRRLVPYAHPSAPNFSISSNGRENYQGDLDGVCVPTCRERYPVNCITFLNGIFVPY